MAEVSDQEYQEYQLYKEAKAEEERIANEPGFFKKLVTSSDVGGYGRSHGNKKKNTSYTPGTSTYAPATYSNSAYVPYPANTNTSFTGSYDMGTTESNIAGGYIAPYTTPLEGATPGNPGGLLVFDDVYKKKSPLEKARTRHEQGKYIWNKDLRGQVKAEVTAEDIKNANTGKVSPEDVEDPTKITGKDGKQYGLTEDGQVVTPDYFGPGGEGISKEKYDEMIAGGDTRLANEQEWNKNQWLHKRGLDDNSRAMNESYAEQEELKAAHDAKKTEWHSAATVDSVTGDEVRFTVNANGHMVNAETEEPLVHAISGEPRMWTKENWYNENVTPDQKVMTDGVLMDAYGYPVTKIVDGNKVNVLAHEIYPDLLKTNTYSKQSVPSLEDQSNNETSSNSSTESDKSKKNKKDKEIDYERRSEVLMGLAGMFTSVAGSDIQW